MKISASLLALVAFTAVQAAAVAEADPRHSRLKGGFCGARGASCAKRRSAEADAEPEAEARRRSRLKGGFCGARGASCAKAKRDANAEADADPEARRSRLKGGFCGARGASCARAVEAINETDPDFLKEVCYEEGNECDTILKTHAAYHEAVKREALAEAEPRRRRHSRLRGGFCGARGASCARDVHEFLEARDAKDPAADVAEKACNAEDGDCTMAELGHDDLGDAIDRALETLSTM